jgi:hypothetical protein
MPRPTSTRSGRPAASAVDFAREIFEELDVIGSTAMKLCRLSAAASLLVVTGALAQQPAPPSASQDPAAPTYESSNGPVVAFDEAHKNTHTYGSRNFRGFVELLRNDGYRPRPLTDPIGGDSLKGIDVLVLSGPGGWESPDASLGDGEIAALMHWVQRGGSLLLILDHMPAPANGARVAAALDVTSWHNGYAMVDVDGGLPVGNIIFWRKAFFPEGAAIAATGPAGDTGYQGVDAVLTDHPITEGRNPRERVRRVATFVGSAFRPPPGSEAVLRLPRRAVSLVPKDPSAADVRIDARRTPVGEWLQGAVMIRGRGRVAVFGETGLFSGGPAADNRQFLLNVMHWLTRVL